MAAPGQDGSSLSQCTFKVCKTGSEILGAGVLVGRRQVLTCSHVAAGFERVELRDGLSSELITQATVTKQGVANSADDLALLELDDEGVDRVPIRFEEPRPGQEFVTLGFPRQGRPKQVFGRVGDVTEQGWLWIDPDGKWDIERKFSGGAVWIPAKNHAVGLISQFDREGVAYAVTGQRVLAFLRDEDAAARCDAYLTRVGRRLASSKVRSAVADGDRRDTWQQAASRGAEPLARELCLETDPDDLAEGLCRAYCKLVEQDTETAEQIFEVLMETLPAALLSQSGIEIPEGSAREVQLELLSRVLAEFALAASEDGAAEFHRQPERKDSDLPRATHRISSPGELGADPEGREAAWELAADAGLRLALDVGSTSESRRESERYLEFLATHRHRDRGVFDPTQLRDLNRARTPASSEMILRVLNKRLARQTSAGRRLYLVADHDDRRVVDGLRELLPGLKIVALEASPEQFEQTEMLLDSLTEIFHRRKKS